MSIFKTKSLIDRLEAALEKAAKQSTTVGGEAILIKAVEAEIAAVKALQNMTGFKEWLEGQQFDLKKARGRR